MGNLLILIVGRGSGNFQRPGPGINQAETCLKRAETDVFPAIKADFSGRALSSAR